MGFTVFCFFFFSSRRRHTSCGREWSSDVCSSDLVKPQHRILLEKFGLEELKLIAIVGGNETAPRAMFVDPTGMGVTVARGDHVSKSDALVSRVAPDRVFFQMEEDTGQSGKPRVSERVIELHAGENIGSQ